MNKLFITFLCILCATINFELDASKYKFRTVTVYDGLIDNIINCQYKDSIGFLWLGTQSGLNRFDGVNIVDIPTLNGRTILSLTESDAKNLWIGTDDGLFILNRYTESLKQFEFQIEGSIIVWNLIKSGKSNVLAATNGGLYVINTDNLSSNRILFDHNIMAAINTIYGIIPDSQHPNLFWCATSAGLVSYNAQNNTFKTYLNPDKERNSFTCIAVYDNTIILGNNNHGMTTFDISTARFEKSDIVIDEIVKSIQIDDSGNIFIGTNGNGIIVYNLLNKQSERIESESGNLSGLCSNAIYSLLLNGNQLFVGTYMSGLSYTPYNSNDFDVLTSGVPFNLYENNIRAFYIDDSGEKVIGTRSGFYYITKDNRVTHYNHKNSSLTADIIMSVIKDGTTYLIGSYGGGLYRFDPQSGLLKYFSDDIPFVKSSFGSYDRDSDGNIYICSSSGLLVYYPINGKYKLFNRSNSAISSNGLFSVKVDSSNRVWIGTDNGISVYDISNGVMNANILPDRIQTLVSSVRFIYEDSHQNLWFCNDKSGIIKADRHLTKFEHITTSDFIPNNSVVSIIEDTNGRGLWFATKFGLSLVGSNNKVIKRVSIAEGIPGYIFNPGAQRDMSGAIWWSNEKGLVRLTPSSIHKQNQQNHAPIISSILVQGIPLSAGSKEMKYMASYVNSIKIKANSNVTFVISDLNFGPEKGELYEYIFEGFDEEWSTLLGHNVISYSNLPAGKYKFHLRSVTAPDKECVVTVNVKGDLPIIIVVVLFLCILIGVIYFYRRQILNAIVSSVNRKEKYVKSKIDGKAANTITDRLIAIMGETKLYLNPDLKLQDVAYAIECQPSELSQILNQYLNTNFPDFLNKYRTEEFISRVKNGDANRFTLVSLSEQCGFSSRTSFFRSFKRIKGVTPSQFLKDLDTK
jgi:ligand-binding sensor domain-containing protein/AraC-like DNA-binding protein